MAARVLIIGGGLPALMAARVFNSIPRVRVTVMDPVGLGGEDLGGLEVVQRTDAMIRFFNNLRMVYSSFNVAGGVLLRGKVQPYPMALGTFPTTQAVRVQADIWHKSRLTDPDEWSKKALLSGIPRAVKALRVDMGTLVKRLVEGVSFTQVGLASANAHQVMDTTGNMHVFDFLIFTQPLWELRGKVPWYVPEAVALNASIALVSPRKDRYAQWDYVNTPYTPADFIHRLSPMGGSYLVEMAGTFHAQRMQSDLHFIFPDGFHVEEIVRQIRGHMIPLRGQNAEWPSNVAPLGPYAQWDSTATPDAVLGNIMALASRWFGVTHVQD